MGGGEVLKKGLLIKSPPMDSGALKMWRRRWFVLLSSKVLEYYKSEGGEQKGVINLEDCHSVNSNLSHKRYKHVFNIETKERVFFLVASSQPEMDAWVEALCKVCGLITDNTALTATLTPLYSTTPSKSKGPNISQPIYATSTRVPSSAGQTHTLESVYSLAAKAEYGTRRTLLRESADVSVGAALSEAVSSGGSGVGSNRVSTASGGSGGDVAGNRLSETAFFSPRPGNTSEFLGEVIVDAPPTGGRGGGSPSRHRDVSKTRSATLMPTLQTDNTLPSLEQRSHSNTATMYSVVNKKSPSRGAQVLSNGYMTPGAVREALPSHPSSGDANTSMYTSDELEQSGLPDIPLRTLDPGTAALEEGYGILHLPPPIDRSNKPPSTDPPPPAIDRALKPGRLRKDPELSDSSEDSRDERRWSLDEPTPDSTHPAGDSSAGRRTGDENETHFNITDIPRITVRTTHYTQVDFDPDKRRPVPLPRKSSAPTSLAPRPQRFNYTDVNLHATTQLSDKLFRQMTVREAEKAALAEKQYVNVDHSGAVDDETDPDYYTHMRDLNFKEADKPDYFSVQRYLKQQTGDEEEGEGKGEGAEEEAVHNEDTHTIKQGTYYDNH